MIWVMMSSLRHTNVLRACGAMREMAQGQRPKRNSARLLFKEGWVEPPDNPGLQVVSAHSLEQGRAL
jgi:hypothetical protein